MPTPFDEKLVHKLRDRDYRAAYVQDVVRVGIALQIRSLREQRGLSQMELGRRMGKPQSVVSRLEDPDYGRLTLQTLFEVGEAFDLPVLVQIVEWDEFLQRTADVSPPALEKRSFDFQRLLGVVAAAGYADVRSQVPRQARSDEPVRSLQLMAQGQPVPKAQGGEDIFTAAGHLSPTPLGRSPNDIAPASVSFIGQGARRTQGSGVSLWS